MKNYVNDGTVLMLTAPNDGVKSGEPVISGALLVVPCITADSGLDFAARYKGVFRVTKKSEDTPSALAKAYWDDTKKHFTTTATGNKLVGVFNEAGVNGQLTIEVLLTGEFV